MTFYRGFNPCFGANSSSSFLWVSDDKEFAKLYGTVAEIEINFGKIKLAGISDLEETCDELDYDILDALYNPTEEMVNRLHSKSFNAFVIPEKQFKCLCLLDKNLIKSLHVKD